MIGVKQRGEMRDRWTETVNDGETFPSFLEYLIRNVSVGDERLVAASESSVEERLLQELQVLRRRGVVTVQHTAFRHAF